MAETAQRRLWPSMTACWLFASKPDIHALAWLTPKSRGVEVTLPANNQELAAQIGTVRELISRNLSRLSGGRWC